jgi:hypothetical protein
MYLPISLDGSTRRANFFDLKLFCFLYLMMMMMFTSTDITTRSDTKSTLYMYTRGTPRPSQKGMTNGH